MSLTAVWDSSPYDAEERAKTRGMRVSASAHHTDLRLAREIARELGRDGRVVSADDVRVALAERFPDIEPGNWLGSVWSERDSWGRVWAPAGFVHSRTKGSHGNRLVQWRLK